jgi:phosphoserine phosphatase RsbU/P
LSSNSKSTTTFRRGGLALRYSLFFLLAFLFIFTVTFFLTFEFTRQILDNDAKRQATNITDLTISRILNVIRPIEQVPHVLATTLAHEKPDYKDIMETAKNFVNEDSVVFGSALAFEPYMHDSNHQRYCQYIFKNKGRIIQKDLDSPEYDYFSREWYRIPKMLGKPVWSEPYYDKGGGDNLICTYSVPFFREIKGERKFAGVITMDISLQTFKQIINSAKVYQTGRSFLVSHSGKFLVNPHESYINSAVLDHVKKRGETMILKAVEKTMNGERIFVNLSNERQEEIPAWIYCAPVPQTGWIFALTFPTEELYSGLYSFFKKLVIIFILSLLGMIILLVMISKILYRPIRRLVDAIHRIGQGDFNTDLPVYRARDEITQLCNEFSGMKEDLIHYIKNLKETISAKEKIDSELSIAGIIQKDMLPRNFPEQENLELHAILDPARAVGGDLYDFYFLDKDHIFIAIGDVSGKGVPAALFMATTRTFFRSKVTLGIPLQQVVKEINMELCKENPKQMFVTCITGIIDLRSGSMTYCNAGHNPPLLVHSSGDIECLNDTHGIPLGILDSTNYSQGTIRFGSDDIFFLYTDGVTEAVRKDDAFYGEERMLEFIRNNHDLSPVNLIAYLRQDLTEWMKDVEQADDITLLAVKYKTKEMQVGKTN